MFFGVNLIGIKHSNGDSNFRTYCIVIVLFRNGNARRAVSHKPNALEGGGGAR